MNMISIIMPVYNAGKYLTEALDSVLAQTYKDFELLLINDGGTDNSEEIIKTYNDPRIIFINNDRNLGLIATLNKGVSIAKGKYIARMDADDICDTHRLEIQMKTFEEHPDCVMVCSPVLGITPVGKLRDHWPADIETNTYEKIRERLPFENCISHPTILIRADVLKKYGYSKNQNGSEDWDLWLRLVRDNNKIVKTKEILLKYRVHPASMTRIHNTLISPQIKSIGVKWRFFLSSLRSLRINLFVLKTLGTIAKDYGYYLKVKKVPATARRLKWCLTINSFKASSEFKLLKEKIENHSSSHFLFFPYSHIGGAEKVHGQITSVVEDKKPFVFFTGLHHKGFFSDQFSGKAVCLHIARALYHPLFAKKTRNLIEKKIIKCEKPVVFGSNNIYLEELILKLPEKVFSADLVHDISYNDESFYNDAYQAMIIRLNARIFISKLAIEKTLKFYDRIFLDDEYKNRITLVYNYVEEPVISKTKEWNTPYTIIYAGRDTVEKNVRRIFELAKACENEKLPYKFLMVGDIKLPQEFSGLKNIEMKGLVLDKKNLSELYAGSHFVIISSDSEGFPLSLTEGMRHGCIALSTPVGDTPSHITHGENGFLTGTDLKLAVNEFLLLLKNMPVQSLPLISANAQEYVSDTFSADNFRQYYRKLLIRD